MPNPIGLVSPKKPRVYAPAGKTKKETSSLVNFSTKQQTVGEQMSERCTGKSFSEQLILVSSNPQYDKRLFIELHV
jgi:hypothetical protein